LHKFAISFKNLKKNSLNMLNPLIFFTDLALKFKIDKKETKGYIERAKEIQDTYNIDESWLGFIKTNSKSSPYNFILASISVFTGFYQLVNTFRQKWTISECWMESPKEFLERDTDPRTYINDYQFCLNLNNAQNTIGFPLFGAGAQSCSNDLFVILAFTTLLNFVLFALVIHRIFTYSKYCVLMMGIQVRIMKVFGVFDMFWIIYLTINILTVGFLKASLADTTCDFLDAEGFSVFMNVKLPNQNILKILAEHLAVHSCFAVLLYKYYTAPVEIYFKPNKYFDFLLKSNRVMAQMNYQIDNAGAIDYIRHYFSNYKKEETKVVLIAIMEHLLDKKLVSEFQKEG